MEIDRDSPGEGKVAIRQTDRWMMFLFVRQVVGRFISSSLFFVPHLFLVLRGAKKDWGGAVRWLSIRSEIEQSHFPQDSCSRPLLFLL